MSEERDQFTAVLESIQADFRLFGEALEMMDGKLDRMSGRLDSVEIRLDRMEIRLDRMEIRMERMESKLNWLETQVLEVRKEIEEIRLAFPSKADLARLARIEQRVVKLEVLTKTKTNEA